MKKILIIILVSLSLIAVMSCQNDIYNEEPETGLVYSGGEIEIVTGTEAGFPLEDYPQIQSITTEEYERLSVADELAETGLFIQDGDYVPFNLDETLAMYRLTLESDGTLIDEEGNLVSLYMQLETMKVIPDEPSTKGNPYPWTYWSTSRNNYRTSGFCRDYIALIHAYAWGTVNGTHVLTRVEYIRTLVGIGTKAEDEDSCSNCDQEYSRASVDLGCWWPTASGSGAQYFYMRDGSLSASKWYDFTVH